VVSAALLAMAVIATLSLLRATNRSAGELAEAAIEA